MSKCVCVCVSVCVRACAPVWFGVGVAGGDAVPSGLPHNSPTALSTPPCHHTKTPTQKRPPHQRSHRLYNLRSLCAWFSGSVGGPPAQKNGWFGRARPLRIFYIYVKQHIRQNHTSRMSCLTIGLTVLLFGERVYFAGVYRHAWFCQFALRPARTYIFHAKFETWAPFAVASFQSQSKQMLSSWRLSAHVLSIVVPSQVPNE